METFYCGFLLRWVVVGWCQWRHERPPRALQEFLHPLVGLFADQEPSAIGVPPQGLLAHPAAVLVFPEINAEGILPGLVAAVAAVGGGGHQVGARRLEGKHRLFFFKCAFSYLAHLVEK